LLYSSRRTDLWQRRHLFVTEATAASTNDGGREAASSMRSIAAAPARFLRGGEVTEDGGEDGGLLEAGEAEREGEGAGAVPSNGGESGTAAPPLLRSGRTARELHRRRRVGDGSTSSPAQRRRAPRAAWRRRCELLCALSRFV
jgi:hypothetical protein